MVDPETVHPGEPLLAFDGVSLSIGEQSILHDLAFAVQRGSTLGIVGESGSGKSLTALCAMRLLPRGSTLSGRIRFDGHELTELDEARLQELRGSDIGMVFQEPMTALNPLHRVGDQIAESIRLHHDVTRDEATTQARRTLDRVGLPSSVHAPERYPHELSGGQRQRVVIAIAIACGPKLLIADEPTTALDVTTQAGILDLLRELQRDEGLSLVFISHDLAVVAEMADELLVMRNGRIVDRGSFAEVFASGEPGYADRLLRASTWRAPVSIRQVSGEPLLRVEHLTCSYPTGPRRLFGERERFLAVDAVSLEVRAGESVGLVGESGCGKSTLTRALLGLIVPDAGEIHFAGTSLQDGHTRDSRRRVQVVFQDPYGSFNPRHRVARLVAEPLHLLEQRPGRRKARHRVAAMLERVGIEGDVLDRYIHEFSGGQRQRIAIARALIVQPSLVVLDEAVSALDVSVRAQVLALLADLATDEQLAYLFISHDLSVVRNVTERVLVMHRGRIVEQGVTAELFAAPTQPYTRSLLAAVPQLPSAREALVQTGSITEPADQAMSIKQTNESINRTRPLS